jgi:hypothetical protein
MNFFCRLHFRLFGGQSFERRFGSVKSIATLYCNSRPLKMLNKQMRAGWIAKRVFVMLTLFGASTALIWAGSVSDCRDDFDSEVASCRSLYDEPDDADDLQQCIQDAQDEYQSCVEECTN